MSYLIVLLHPVVLALVQILLQLLQLLMDWWNRPRRPR